VAILASCTNGGATDSDGDTDLGAECGAPYEPFDPANYESQFQRVAAFTQIVAIRKSDTFSAADFTEIEDLDVNTAALQAKVQGREDDHDDAAVAALGVELDAAITAAIAAGKEDDNIDVQGQIIDKTLQRFFYLSVYHEMMKSQDDGAVAADVEKGWDEGFGYFGVENDGQNPAGIALTLSKRDEEFGLSLVDTAYNGLVDGRCLIEEGDTEGLPATIEAIDLALLRGFGASVVHEMDEFSEEPDIKFWEGLLYWEIVADTVATIDPDARSAIDAEFAEGAVDILAFDAALVRTEVMTAFGFDW
jgi:hypothetical protein